MFTYKLHRIRSGEHSDNKPLLIIMVQNLSLKCPCYTNGGGTLSEERVLRRERANISHLRIIVIRSMGHKIN
jgi:hypothetical protein